MQISANNTNNNTVCDPILSICQLDVSAPFIAVYQFPASSSNTQNLLGHLDTPRADLEVQYLGYQAHYGS